MNELINFVINFAITYFLMRIALAFFNASQQTKNEHREHLKKMISTIVHTVKEEQHGEQIYWFDKDTDAFIIQGTNFDDIVKNLKKHFSDHIFILNDRFILSGPDWLPQEHKQLDIKIFDK